MALGSTGAAAAAPMVETLMHAAIRTAAQGVFFSIVIVLAIENLRPLPARDREGRASGIRENQTKAALAGRRPLVKSAGHD